MTILIFGKSGQIGCELSRTLLVHGRLIAVDSAAVDLSKPSSVMACLERACPTVIVNAAAYTAVDKAESDQGQARAVNAFAVSEMSNYAAANDTLLVHYSTDYVFDGDKIEPYLPSDKPNPLSIYGQTKLEGEQAIRASGCKHLIFRTSWVYSVHGENFIKTILRLATERNELRVVHDQHGSPTSAELIADVTSLALSGYKQGLIANGTYHLTARGGTSWYDLACRTIDRAITNGWNSKLSGEQVEAIPTVAFPTAATRPSNSLMDSSDLEKALELQLPDWTLHVDRVIDQITSKKAY